MNGRTPQALIVDDDESTRFVVRRVVEELGLGIIETDDGADAPELIAAHPFDLLIIDLYMPGMNGFELLRRVRAVHGGLLAPRRTDPAVPVLVLSGESHAASIRNAKRLGASAYVTKPIDIDELSAVVRRLLATP